MVASGSQALVTCKMKLLLNDMGHGEKGGLVERVKDYGFFFFLDIKSLKCQ